MIHVYAPHVISQCVCLKPTTRWQS